MRLEPIGVGDLIKCDVRGRIFLATVERLEDDGSLRIQPIARGVTYRHVRARQVIDHWRHGMRQVQRGPTVPDGQLELTGGASR